MNVVVAQVWLIFSCFVARTAGCGHLAGEKHQGKGQASGEDKSTSIIFLKLFLRSDKRS